jgi:cytochrome c peroxidase
VRSILALALVMGRTITSGPNQGVGHDNANKNPTIRGFALTRGQRDDLIAFLHSLTDELLRDGRFRDPWPSGYRR